MAVVSERLSRLFQIFLMRRYFFPDPALQKTEAFTFISVGEPAYTKGLDILIKAFAALKNKMPGSSFQLILADKIPEKKELRALAEAVLVFHIDP